MNISIVKVLTVFNYIKSPFYANFLKYFLCNFYIPFASTKKLPMYTSIIGLKKKITNTNKVIKNINPITIEAFSDTFLYKSSFSALLVLLKYML